MLTCDPVTATFDFGSVPGIGPAPTLPAPTLPHDMPPGAQYTLEIQATGGDIAMPVRWFGWGLSNGQRVPTGSPSSLLPAAETLRVVTDTQGASDLWRRLAQGQLLGEARLTVHDAAGQTYLRYTLTQVVVSAYRVYDAPGAFTPPTVEMQLAFCQLTSQLTGGPLRLQVRSVTPTATGVTVQLSRPIEPGVLNLYDGQGSGGLGPADFTLVRSGFGPVAGSLVLNANNTGFTFVQTGGRLPADMYTVTLRSNSAAFRTLDGELLDGDNDCTPGGDFTTTFFVPSIAVAVVSVPDFARGPGQAVNVPASAATGIPLRLTHGAGVDSINLTLRYDPALLRITGAALGPGAPPDSQLMSNIGTPGMAVLAFNSPTPLEPGTIPFVTLTADVPASAASLYTRKQILDITGLQVNGGAIIGRDDDGIHVVSYFGDATGNGTYSASDATRALRVAVGLDSGFAAYQLADPVIVADISGDGFINSTDATRILQEVVGLDRPEIPPLPGVPPPPAPAPPGPADLGPFGSATVPTPPPDAIDRGRADRAAVDAFFGLYGNTNGDGSSLGIFLGTRRKRYAKHLA